MNKNLILLENNLVPALTSCEKPQTTYVAVGTIINNLLHYGFMPNKVLMEQLQKADPKDLEVWWAANEPALEEITAKNRKMAEHVVYKNFPKEVLDMSQAEYWIKQVLMYWGLPSKYVTQKEKPRKALDTFELKGYKVLQPANEEALQNILNGLLASPTKWTHKQWDTVKYLMDSGYLVSSNIPFKENMVQVITNLPNLNSIQVSSATDVLRIATGLSGGDITLKTNTKFGPFPRKQRKLICQLLERSSNLEEDFGRDKERWKKLVKAVHPNDFPGTNLKKAASKLYQGGVQSFDGKVEELLKKADPKALTLLKNRPGDFVRRFNQLQGLYKLEDLMNAFKAVVPKLKIKQLLKFEAFVRTINARKFAVYTPKGNWAKAQIKPNVTAILPSVKKEVLGTIKDELVKRFATTPVQLDPSTQNIVLPTGEGDALPYGRGTKFAIPKEMTFLRTASYWEHKGVQGATWFDNSWNFFDKDWKPKGVCCWNANIQGGGAIFSGDPINTKDMKGRACQVIDLYINKLQAAGIRYAVWSILCYSRVTFDQAKDVLGVLQWGADPFKGGIFESERTQLSIPVKGKTLCKYIAYVDLNTMELVTLDLPLKGSVTTAESNQKVLSELLPAIIDSNQSLPTVFDLFKNAPTSEEGMPVVYSDASEKVEAENAYVFLPKNTESAFKNVSINQFLE